MERSFPEGGFYHIRFSYLMVFPCNDLVTTVVTLMKTEVIAAQRFAQTGNITFHNNLNSNSELI